LKATIVLLVMISFIFGQEKIGYVDMTKIEQGYSEMSKYKTESEKLIKKYEDRMKKLRDEYVQMGQNFQSQRLLLTQSKQEEKMREIQLKEQEIARFQQEKLVAPAGEMHRKLNELQKPYLDKILAAIKSVAKDKGIDLMLNNAQGIVLHTSDKIDYSKEVIDHLNKKKN